MLRFDTGDLVEIGPACELGGESGFKIWGKSAHSFRLKHGDLQDLYPVRYGAIQECLDTSPLVNRIKNTRHSLVTPTEGESFVKWRLVSDPATPRVVSLQVEMLFDPRLFMDVWLEFKSRLEAEIQSSTPQFRIASDNGFVFNVVGLPPGTLDDSQVMRS